MKKKVVMHLIATSFYGGPEKQIVEHLKCLKESDFVGIAVSFTENEGDNQFITKARQSGLEYELLSATPMSAVAHVKILRSVLKNRSVDLLCTHGYKSTVIGWVAAKSSGIPILAFSRGYTGENYKVLFYEWLDRRIINLSDGVVCVAEGQRSRLQRLGVRTDQGNCWVVHNAALFSGSGNEHKYDKVSFCRDIGVPEKSILTVAAGRASREKGQNILVSAMAEPVVRSLELVCLVCGDGPDIPRLRRQARSLNVEESCIFLGFREDIQQIFEIMDFLVLPSLSEGLPNVILESFASSKPVVASDVGGVPEIIEDGVNGLLVEPGSVARLAGAIGNMAIDRNLRTKMGRNGFRTVSSRFTFRSQSEKLQKIYGELLAENSVE